MRHSWRYLGQLNERLEAGESGLLADLGTREELREAFLQVRKKGLPDEDEVPGGDPVACLVRLADFCSSAGVEETAAGFRELARSLRFAIRLKGLRSKAGFSIRELAKYAGLNHTYISRLERGTVVHPSPDTVRKLAPLLGVTPGDLDERLAEEREGVGAGWGLNRPLVRRLLHTVWELPDNYLELLIAQAEPLAKMSRQAGKEKRGSEDPDEGKAPQGNQ